MASLAYLAGVSTEKVKGVGPAAMSVLSRVGINSITDLLHHVPHRYIDRSDRLPIADAPLGVEVTFTGEILSIRHRQPRRNLKIFEVMIADDSGTIKGVWFNQAYRLKQMGVGSVVSVSGVVEAYRGTRQLSVTAIHDAGEDRIDTGRVVPVYSEPGKLKQGDLRKWLQDALTRSKPIEDPLPIEILATRGLMDREQAYDSIHFPETMDAVHLARRRLVYDELFRLQLAFALRKAKRIADASGIVHDTSGELAGRFIEGLPYQLTDAQNRVLEEIRSDLRANTPMHRLLQGDVGSGKTVVAVAALLDGIEGGWQGAIMAPTEVLAEQHFLGVARLLADAGIAPEPFATARGGMDSLFTPSSRAVNLALLTGSTAVTNYDGKVSRERLLADIASGTIDLVVGTHALIQEGVEFNRLGVAVVDEQHRFGVEQRREIKVKAGEVEPDLLIMSATPIPRTLSMTIYGDLDESRIDEMPPGRSPLKTTLLPRGAESKAWHRVGSEVAAGRQVFVVCPLVEDSDSIEASSATAERERLSAIFPDLEVGLIHGQMRPVDKEAAMSAFRSGETQVLVSTTVIEVGIDVPNATLMVIEDADRFGLSQLHQLRGRVGRGQHPGECILIAEPTTEEAEQRLGAMLATTDGFELAIKDLEIRGYGTVFGERQSGVKDLVLADILNDIDALHDARRDAFALVASDPDLSQHPDLLEEIRVLLGEAVEWLFVS